MPVTSAARATGADRLRSPVAWRPVLAVAAVVAAGLIATSGRYGYHRDELYFLQAGRHLAWGYPDQPPLTPLLARLMSAVAGNSLVALRLPSAIAAAGIVVLTGLLARELDSDRAGQLLAAASIGASALLLAIGHLLSTTTFDVLAWTALTYLVVRILLRGEERLWLAAGLVVGVGMLDNVLVAFLAFGLLAGVLVAGPRSVLRGRWLWLGAGVAAVLAAPYLLWQATHGWPQLAVSRAIAAGGSGTSQPRALFVPFQLVLVSPLVVPVWLAGLVRLLRDVTLARVRALAWTYLVLAAVFLAVAGKPYYLGGLYPLLLAAGAAPVLAWLRRGAGRGRQVAVVAAVVVSGAVSMVLMLPVLPLSVLHATPVVAVNYDAGETIGWPTLVDTVDRVYRRLSPPDRAGAVILTANYGEAGAIDRYGPALGLPPAYSGHNAYAEWGPPPDTAAPGDRGVLL